MKVGGQILWNVTPIWETSHTCYLMERRPVKDVLGEYHSTTAKDLSKIHHFGRKVFPGLFFGYALYAEGLNAQSGLRKAWCMVKSCLDERSHP